MATIFENQNYPFSESAKLAIQEACAAIGVEEVNSTPPNGSMIDLVDNSDNYLFTIDTNTDLISVRKSTPN